MNTGRIVGITPFENPDASLALALVQAGAIGIMDLGRNPAKALQASRQLEALLRPGARGLGVRLADPSVLAPGDLPEGVSYVVIDAGHPIAPWKNSKREIWVQVCSLEEAKAAINQQPAGLIVKGSESGGRVGTDASFILLQEVRKLGIPFWVQGGIGTHTAAACIVAGASGVVFDSQLALLRESTAPDDIKKALSHSDGTETRIVHGHQVFTRPDLQIPGENDITLAAFTARLGGTGLKENFVPVGQDMCLAKRIAEKYVTTRAFVQSLKRSTGGHVRQAKKLSVLAPGSALARAYNTQYAIAQGPMTRVSDRAEFIDAVSTNGAMPFLALSLMNKVQCREILTETAARLGSKPWGVGILGFVAEELHRDQLEVLADFNPSAMLIAGGRPSQAETFEKRGIRTFLHVPSPGLLKQYLKEGSRRFVFEGRECGGHVGPRSSFVLWEAQIEVLLAFEAVHEVEVYFAGGIHDELSGAMVSTMAAPLVARGAKVGALIGTAYLFTREAVESGAILPRFQKEAIDCKTTALLESGPGHATRCAFSPFVDKFQKKKDELKAAQMQPKEIWAELEGLNVGRLRVASKGVERVGKDLVPVDEARQREEGLFMLGQVAQLRDQVCTMRELHQQITEGSVGFLDAIETESEKGTAPLDVAIVGMACIFPGAKDVGQFWKNILAGTSAVTEVPKERWNVDAYFEENTQNTNKSISKWGGFIDDASFDPIEYGIPPNSIGAIEPIQLLSLKVAKQALADAGYAEKAFDRERASVIFGAEAGTDLSGAYGFRALYPQVLGKMPKELDEYLPTLSEDSFPGILANVISGRIANRLDLGGSNYTVDAACGSSIAALDLSVKELINGESDLVLCGGADLHNGINDYLMFSSVHALSPTGQIRPFSAEANGIVLGEGVAVIVLKRLDDAIRDGDRVYAVVKSVGASSDGKSLGLTAPRKEGQMRALYRAYERAGVNPSDVELVEAHGTGTVVGDRTELETLTDVFAEAGTLNRSCALGSVKSQIGHTKCAAGLAGIIKTSLSVYHGIFPPTISVDNPNPGYHRESSPFFFTQTPIPWTSDDRKAGVSAFGFGGTNFHAVLASHQPEGVATAPHAWPSELFLFDDRSALEKVAKIIDAKLELDFARLSRTVTGAGTGKRKQVFAAIVAKDFADLGQKIAQALRGESAKGVFIAKPIDPSSQGQLAFLFSGQGSQSVNMGAEIFNAFPHLRKYLKLAAKWTDKIYPKGKGLNAEEELKQTHVTQPALGLIELALFHLTQDLGIEADLMAGHSYGELVALCAAGAIREEDLLGLSEARGLAIQSASAGKQGAMAAVFADAATTEAVIQGLDVVVANYNSPTQSVISGIASQITLAIQKFEAKGIRAQQIAVSCAFHSPLIQGAEAEFAQVLSQVELRPARKIVYSNTTGVPHPVIGNLAAALAGQITRPVQFVREIETMHADGARIFLEVGPSSLLKNLVGQILHGKQHAVCAMDRAGSGLEQLLLTLAELSSLGVAFDPTVLYASRELLAYDLEKLQTEQVSPTLWFINGHLAKPKSGVIPKGALKPLERPFELSFSPSTGPASGDRESLVKEYLQSMRLLVEGQRQVMLQFLGGDPGAQAMAQTPIKNVKSEVAASLVTSPRAAAVAPAETARSRGPEVLDVHAVVLSVVSTKTGYPEEMLGLDQDLEADLSIDSIKRFEILAEIGEKLSLTGQSGGKGEKGGLDKLASIKTLRALIAALNALKPAAAPSVAAAQAAQKIEQAEDAVVALPVGQFQFTIDDAPFITNTALPLESKSFGIIGKKGAMSDEIIELLRKCGATATVLNPAGGWEDSEAFDGLILLNLLEPTGYKPVDVFKTLRRAACQGAHWIIGVTGRGGTFGYSRKTAATDQAMGISGLFKSLAKEYNGKKVVKLVDVDTSEEPVRLAQQIFIELQSADKLVEVGYYEGMRKQCLAVPLTLDLGPSMKEKLDLTKDSVVLMLGGARGIAAKIATRLAKEYGCRFEFVGRSPLPGAEAAETLGCLDVQALRTFLVKSGKFKKPSEIEAECKRILNDREMRNTLSTLEGLGSRVGYHCFDVRDKVTLGALIDQLYAVGKIDGVIHAAGVLSDSLLMDKSEEAFTRVFETKMNPAEVLEAKLRNDVKFVALFSSVSGCFGNRGQTDYSAANNALDHMARVLGERIEGQTVSFNWGPWAETGMVTAELEREYRKQGIGLIPPAEGSQKFLDQLRFGDQKTRQVVIMSGALESFT